MPVFRSLWFANIASNFGGLVQTVGAAWLMTLMTDNAAMVALVQASTTLPVMVFSIFAGAIADSYDRRRVMLAAQSFMFVVSVALVAITWSGHINEWSLLAATFLIGCGLAFHIPSWQASVGDIVGKDILPAAVVLNGVGFNVTRSVAPAIGGSIVAAFGAVAAFAVNALSYIGLIGVIWRWSGAAPPTRTPEALPSAILAGVRYVGLSPNLVRVLIRSFVWGLTTVIVLALLPLISKDLLGGGAVVFGVLLGAFGVGAVVGGLLSGKLRARTRNETIVRCAFVSFAAASLIIAHSPWLPVTALAVALAGGGWVIALSLFNTSVQIATPRWVVGRALSLYQMSAFGGMAVGSWVWGSLTELESLTYALQIAAASMLVGALLGLRLALPDPADMNLDPLNRWQIPDVGIDLLPRSGPISIAIVYDIDAADHMEFLSLMQRRERVRRRDGARQWTLLRDLQRPNEWIERFELPTWAEYVRFHERTTQEDGKVGDRLRALHRGKQRPAVRRMLIRDPSSGRTTEAPGFDPNA